MFSLVLVSGSGPSASAAQALPPASEVIIPHKVRYFIWLKRLPSVPFGFLCPTCR